LNSNSTGAGLVTLTTSEPGVWFAPICTLGAFSNDLHIKHPIDGEYIFKISRRASAGTQLNAISIATGAVTIPSRFYTVATNSPLPGFSAATRGPYSYSLSTGDRCVSVSASLNNNLQQVNASLINSNGAVTAYPAYVLNPTVVNTFSLLTGQYALATNTYTNVICGLTTGNNVITFTVTAQDGATTGTYTINVLRARSNNALLANVVFYAVDPVTSLEYPAPYDRQFNGNDRAPYSVRLSNQFQVGVLVAAAQDYTATIEISAGGEVFRTYNTSLPSKLSEGTTAFIIRVTAESGVQTIYTVMVTRLPVSGFAYVGGAFSCACGNDAINYKCAAGSLFRTNLCQTYNGLNVDFGMCRDMYGKAQQLECRSIQSLVQTREFPQYINNGNPVNACPSNC
jgi:hypothetical protein